MFRTVKMDRRAKKIVKANKIRKRERLKRNLEDVSREIENLEREIREG